MVWPRWRSGPVVVVLVLSVPNSGNFRVHSTPIYGRSVGNCPCASQITFGFKTLVVETRWMHGHGRVVTATACHDHWLPWNTSPLLCRKRVAVSPLGIIYWLWLLTTKPLSGYFTLKNTNFASYAVEFRIPLWESKLIFLPFRYFTLDCDSVRFEITGHRFDTHVEF